MPVARLRLWERAGTDLEIMTTPRAKEKAPRERSRRDFGLHPHYYACVSRVRSLTPSISRTQVSRYTFLQRGPLLRLRIFKTQVSRYTFLQRGPLLRLRIFKTQAGRWVHNSSSVVRPTQKCVT